ncbi:MAG: VWA domain-containing protein [Rubrivivax sp.]|nr:MAG: VWA domain-containing protein [Rubrivivax sp.]
MSAEPGDEAARHLLHRAAVAHAVAHLRFSAPATPAAGLKPMSIALISSFEDARVERLMLRAQPGLHDWFLGFLQRALRPEGVGFEALVSRLDLALMDPAYEDEHPWIRKARGLFEAQAASDLQDALAFQALALRLVHDLGQMRVPFRPGQYRVPAPYRDDNSFLWSYPLPETDASQALSLSVPQAAPEPRPFAPRDERALPLPAEERAMSTHHYPEWDHRRQLARHAWCTVLEKRPAWQPSASGARPGMFDEALPLKLRAVQRLAGGRRLRRQREGDELDLDAAIQFMVEHRSHRATDARLFTRLAAAERPASILVLLDLSESTNDRLGDGAQTFLDLEKQAALMLASAAAVRGDRIAVHGFSSNTRAEVSYYPLLDFGMALSAPARMRLATAPGRHSTRIGAALRHATAHLARETNELKAILLITDGAPSDIDVHEPRYLVEDAHHAVLAARAAGVQVHGLAVDRQADADVRRIFGWRGHHLVDDPTSLPARLCGIYRRLTAV